MHDLPHLPYSNSALYGIYAWACECMIMALKQRQHKTNPNSNMWKTNKQTNMWNEV